MSTDIRSQYLSGRHALPFVAGRCDPRVQAEAIDLHPDPAEVTAWLTRAGFLTNPPTDLPGTFRPTSEATSA